jgi:hypothetical protein
VKRLLILSFLAMTACAPILSAVQGDPATFARDNGGVLLGNKSGPGPLVAPTVRLEGPGLVMSAPCVARAVNVYGCVLPDVPEGQAYRLTPIGGTITKGSVTYYRSNSGARFIYRELP